MKALTALGVSLILTTTALTAAPAAAAPAVRVVGLRVDGRADRPLGLDDPAPLLSWRFAETRSAAADRQTAYQVRVRDLDGDRMLWDSGRVGSAIQSGVRYGGAALGSRQRLSWQVRAWDAHRRASGWSQPSTWETGLLEQSDWGAAKWIEYPGRAETQPMPIFARQFTVEKHRRISHARLYLSGVGLHLPTVNGRRISDEVLAPGYSNYQLSSEYRAYDITGELRGGANSVGVRLGNGPAYVRRGVTNPAVGRTAPYSWWQSQLKGRGVLTAGVRRRRHRGAARHRHRLPRRRHRQRRHRRRRRQPGVAHHHRDRRRRHHVHPGPVEAAPGRRHGHRLRQQHRRQRRQRRRGRHAPADRAPRDRVRPRSGDRDRL
nr:hypothetical protein GCM10020092_069740 [Actinoplanes digitatis]